MPFCNTSAFVEPTIIPTCVITGCERDMASNPHHVKMPAETEASATEREKCRPEVKHVPAADGEETNFHKEWLNTLKENKMFRRHHTDVTEFHEMGIILGYY